MSAANTEFMESKTTKPLPAVRIEIAQGAVAHNQSHSSETLVIVLEGVWRFRMPDRVVTLKKDELLHIPAREFYSSEALADTVALKIAPSRQENQYVAMPHDDPDQYLWGV
jgi:quercetin dioxygenase-like cupin family protein